MSLVSITFYMLLTTKFIFEFSHVLETCVGNWPNAHSNTKTSQIQHVPNELTVTLHKKLLLTFSGSIVSTISNSVSQIKSPDISLDPPIFLTR